MNDPVVHIDDNTWRSEDDGLSYVAWMSGNIRLSVDMRTKTGFIQRLSKQWTVELSPVNFTLEQAAKVLTQQAVKLCEEKEKEKAPDLEYICDAIVEKFGEINLEKFIQGSWRATLRNYHFSHGSMSGSVVGHGDTAAKAAEKLLTNISSYDHVASGNTYSCKHCRENDCD